MPLTAPAQLATCPDCACPTAPPPCAAACRRQSLDEYIRSCLFLQTAARTFGAFDPQRTGQVHLSFNQFVYAASHVSNAWHGGHPNPKPCNVAKIAVWLCGRAMCLMLGAC